MCRTDVVIRLIVAVRSQTLLLTLLQEQTARGWTEMSCPQRVMSFLDERLRFAAEWALARQEDLQGGSLMVLEMTSGQSMRYEMAYS